VSIIEAGVFIIAGCLATMRVLLLIGLPSKLHSQQKVSLKEWTPNSVGEEDGFPTKVSYGQAWVANFGQYKYKQPVNHSYT